MKKGKTRKLTRRILSFVLTTALVVGLMPGNILTVSAEGTDTVISDELIVESVSSNDASATTECTCETDDPAFHATNCPAYIAPENPQCYCAEKCTDDTLNVWCDVCGVQGVSACQGEETAVAYEILASGNCGAEGNESNVTWSLDSEGTLTISGTGAMADYEWVEVYPYHYTTPWHDTDNDGEYQNSNIKKVVVKEGITHIGNAAFRDFNELTSISIPNTVKSIGYRSVSYCWKLESLVIPDSVTSIGEEAFDYNVMLTSVTIGNNVESIGAYAFSYAGVNAGSTFTITLPKSVTSIDSKAFSEIDSGATIRYSCSYNDGNGYSAKYTNATLEKYHLCEYSSSGNKINCSGCTCEEYSSSTATLSLSSDEPIYYTGEEIKPAVTVTYPDDWGGDKIEPNESNCTYLGNINAGTATCTFKYAEGVEASIDFTIAECPHWGVDSDGMCDNCDYLDEPERVDEYYQIANAGNLMWFAQQVNKGQTAINAKLTADIAMNGIDWTMMSSFAGTFDGDGHAISGLNGHKADTGDTHGFIRTLADGGVVKNLTFTEADIWNHEGSGAISAVIVYTNNGTVENCVVKESVIQHGNYDALGVVVGVNGGTIRNCASISNTMTRRFSSAKDICGFVWSNSGSIENCFNYDCTYQNGSNRYAFTGINNGTITNCYYYESSETISDTVVDAKTADQFAGGEVAYLLQSGQTADTETSEIPHVWGQTLTGENAQVYPVLNGDKVYRYESVKCDSSSKDPAVYGYSNEEKSDVIDEHNVDSNGFCTACGAYEKPETDENGVYQISNAGELYWFADKVNNDNANYGSANAKLTADIVVNSDENISSYNGTDSVSWRPWTPIGNNSNKYTGTFDGNNKTVSGLYFNNTSQNYVGLFGYLDDGEIKNVGVVNSYFNGNNYVGGVCGRNYGTITNCYNTGTVVGAWYVGGVCSYNSGGTIENCYNTGCVSATFDYVGGVCGNNSGGTIENCYNTGCVSGTYSVVGGVCGYNYVGPIKNCYYDNTVYTGNAVGSNSNGTLTSVEGKSTDQFASGEVTYLLQSAQTADEETGIVPHVWGQTLTGENKQTCPVLGGAKVYGGDDACGTDYSNKTHESIENGFCTACGAYEQPETDEKGVYQISNAGELYWFAEYVNAGNKSVNAVLTDNIVVNSGTFSTDNAGNPLYNGEAISETNKPVEWTPINKYTGTFNGQNHTISGLYFNNTSQSYVGLFGITNEGAQIKNVGVINLSFISKGSVGGICACNIKGRITNCYSSGTVSGASYYVGGVCGRNQSGIITNCYNTGDVSGSEDVGGVCGINQTNGTITNCYNTGDVSGNVYVGGVCGSNYDATITNCYSRGTVSGSEKVGGVCGYNNLGTVTNCYSRGTVSGSEDVGGVCGYNNLGTVTNCYYDSTVYTGDAVGYSNGTTTDVEGKTTAQFASGEVAYLLNGSSSENVTWYQKLLTDTYPVLDSKHGIVYSVFKCDGMTPAGYSNENKNEPHAEENGDGYCDVCGTKKDGISATLAGHSVSLGGQIGMNFYMDLDDSVLADGEAHMLFTLPGGSEQRVNVVDVLASTETINEKTYYVFTCEVAAKDMAGIITAKIVCGDGNGGTVEGTEYTYSVREYAEALMQNNNATQEQKALAKAMLNYGAYAQQYFDADVEAEDLANVNHPYSAVEFTVATNELGSYVPTVTDNSATLNYAGSTLILEADIKVRHYFKLKDGQTYSGNLQQYTAPDGETVEGTYYFFDKTFVAAKLGDMTQYTVEGIDFKYCPLSYVTTVLAKKDAELVNEFSDLENDTALQNLMKALYLYYKATVAPNNQS